MSGLGLTREQREDAQQQRRYREAMRARERTEEERRQRERRERDTTRGLRRAGLHTTRAAEGYTVTLPLTVADRLDLTALEHLAAHGWRRPLKLDHNGIAVEVRWHGTKSTR